MAKTETVTIEETPITLVRPTFGKMGTMAAAVQKLYEMSDAGAVLTHPSFAVVVEKACATPADYEMARELSFAGMWELWEAYLDFGGYEQFFTEASERQRRRQEELTERRLKAQSAQFDQMKRLGFLDKDFSLGDVMKDSLIQGAHSQLQTGAPTPNVGGEEPIPTSPSFTTTTPEPTAGDPKK
ncbi:MAG: hypothetical protein H0U69_03335 [Trueperaceae bacterium]|nr:hypothetical protein [Trueperaceae bacterium]